ncbi:YT521-B-like domain-containing protein [Lipomyces japonicus]|uniref:YT521-B-like domain-containing protein n=1 Tax=Lipomyces japonicus TaxID=56871 RepID=UPI0034CD3930
MFASPEIESVFLISKSNCGFVNYSNDTAVREALDKFKRSGGILKGTKLVARMQRGSLADQDDIPSSPLGEAGISGVIDVQKRENRTEAFFVVKSLTVEDLELSVRTGVWATQAHNEQVLNNAYKSFENVYLIFSANKSGEYFGYARMSGPIVQNGTATPASTPRSSYLYVSNQQEFPQTTYTPATDTAPAGRIIDDSSRGTIFWEIVTDAIEHTEESDQAVLKTWGTPFKVTWISTNRVPFFKTRGLKNGWNANRDVKIARDGTELETTVGQKLISLFNAGSPSLPAISAATASSADVFVANENQLDNLTQSASVLNFDEEPTGQDFDEEAVEPGSGPVVVESLVK